MCIPGIFSPAPEINIPSPPPPPRAEPPAPAVSPLETDPGASAGQRRAGKRRFRTSGLEGINSGQTNGSNPKAGGINIGLPTIGGS